jgi:hypothetical protein
MNKKYEEFKISLISHFYFSVIFEKIKETDEPLKLVLNIKDELDYVETKKEFEMQQIDFICEADIMKINYREFLDSMNLMEKIEKQEKIKLNELENDKDKNRFIDYDNKNEKIGLPNYNQFSDVLKNLNYLKNIVKGEKLKIVNVDGISKNYELI